jgi:hypothetical protein
MIPIRLIADTEEELKEESERYLDRWPTQGYSTHIRDPKQQDDGTWLCTGYRWESCD